MQWIALDLGSTHTKCAVIDAQAGVLCQTRVSTPSGIALARTRYEIDAETYFGVAEGLLREALSPKIAGVILSTQMHGYVLTDEAFRPVSPYVSWRDRAALECAAAGRPWLDVLADQLSKGAMDETGVPLKPNLAMAMLYARLSMGERITEGTRFHTLGGYLIGRLTGEHVCHATNAAPTGLLDVRRGQWNPALIRSVGLGGLRFGRVLSGYPVAGVWRAGKQAVPIMPDIGDQQVCVLSADLPQETGLHVNIGTAGLIGLVTRTWVPGDYEQRPWMGEGAYVRTVSGLPGGLAIDTMPPEAYPQVAQAYCQAAQRLGLPIRHVGFSGGCALHNAALRREILNALGLPEVDAGKSDVMQGMQRLAVLGEQTLRGNF